MLNKTLLATLGINSLALLSSDRIRALMIRRRIGHLPPSIFYRRPPTADRRPRLAPLSRLVFSL